MPGTHQDETSSNLSRIRPAGVAPILENLRSLRDQIVTAWRERGVMLSDEEQRQLHAEIKQTCEFLTDLTHRP